MISVFPLYILYRLTELWRNLILDYKNSFSFSQNLIITRNPTTEQLSHIRYLQIFTLSILGVIVFSNLKPFGQMTNLFFFTFFNLGFIFCFMPLFIPGALSFLKIRGLKFIPASRYMIVYFFGVLLFALFINQLTIFLNTPLSEVESFIFSICLFFSCCYSLTKDNLGQQEFASMILLLSFNLSFNHALLITLIIRVLGTLLDLTLHSTKSLRKTL